jgi:acetyl esterase/lipase
MNIRKTGITGLCLLLFAAAAYSEITPDVVYGHKDGMALTYDVFVPDEPNGAAVLFMVSGGWFSVWQAPEQRLPGFQSLLDAGFTVFAVLHGSAPRFKVPEAVSDVRAAVRHIRANSDDYGIDADRIGVFGGSAGGHLSLMLGLAPEAEFDQPEPQGRRMLVPFYAVDPDVDGSVAAVVAYYPPADIRPLVGPNERFPALDFAPESAAAISPILFVTSDDPPTLLIHGDADELVPIRNSELLNAAFEDAGVEHEFVVMQGGAHGFRGEQRTRANALMVEWFKEHLDPAPLTTD